jgi:uncharacterized protein YggE
MKRTITVTGEAKVSAKPDLVILSLSLEALDQEYEQAMEKAAKQMADLDSSLAAAGFEKDAIKTTSFQVETDYERIQDENGNWKNVFNGYKVYHRLKVEFDFDTEVLARALNAVSESSADPQLSVNFTIKDPSDIKEKLLESLTKNAKRKALVLCEASGLSLGDLLTINYSWGEINLVSDTDFRLENSRTAMLMEESIDIRPDDIDLRDSALFVWEIGE